MTLEHIRINFFECHVQFKEVTSSFMWCHLYLLNDSGETSVFLLNSEYFGGPSGATKARPDDFATAPHIEMCGSQDTTFEQESKLLYPFLPPTRSPSLHMHPLVCTARHFRFEYASLGLSSKSYNQTFNIHGSPASPACEQLPGELTTALVVILGRGDPIFYVA